MKLSEFIKELQTVQAVTDFDPEVVTYVEELPARIITSEATPSLVYIEANND